MEKAGMYIWLFAGISIAVYGFISFKFNKYGMIFWFNKKAVKHKRKFTDYFGKNITFLGLGTAVSAFFFIRDAQYLTVSLIINILIAVYFILESFHLIRLYSKDVDDTDTNTVK